MPASLESGSCLVDECLHLGGLEPVLGSCLVDECLYLGSLEAVLGSCLVDECLHLGSLEAVLGSCLVDKCLHLGCLIKTDSIVLGSNFNRYIWFMSGCRVQPFVKPIISCLFPSPSPLLSSSSSSSSRLPWQP